MQDVLKSEVVDFGDTTLIEYIYIYNVTCTMKDSDIGATVKIINSRIRIRS